MKFKIDQNLPVEAAKLLATAGHDAMTVYQQSLGGASDAPLTVPRHIARERITQMRAAGA